VKKMIKNLYCATFILVLWKKQTNCDILQHVWASPFNLGYIVGKVLLQFKSYRAAVRLTVRSLVVFFCDV